jgi:hypothetical protein
VTDTTVHTWVYRANGAVVGLGLPWKLEADGVTRHVRKSPR